MYGVDHGVCFSVEDKLRTLLWGWRGKQLTEEAVDVLASLRIDLDGGSLGDGAARAADRATRSGDAAAGRRLLSTGRTRAEAATGRRCPGRPSNLAHEVGT